MRDETPLSRASSSLALGSSCRDGENPFLYVLVGNVLPVLTCSVECVVLGLVQLSQTWNDLVSSFCCAVPKKRGKLVTFLRSLVKARPKKPKEREVEKERVFGCDLGEHLLHSGRDGKGQPIAEVFLGWVPKDEREIVSSKGQVDSSGEKGNGSRWPKDKLSR